MSRQHEPLPGYAGCTCGAEGFTLTLACGHRRWSHGPARAGAYAGCCPALNGPYPPGVIFGCQAQRKVVAIHAGLPSGGEVTA